MRSNRNIFVQNHITEMGRSNEEQQLDTVTVTPVYESNSALSLNMPKPPTQDAYYDLNQTNSIEQYFINNHSNLSRKKYKCFKCFGRDKRLSFKYNRTHCAECEDTQYISDNHALANILDRLLMIKIPQLPPRNKQNGPRSSRDLNCGRNSVTEQNIYFQTYCSPRCQICSQDCYAVDYQICSVCQNFAICNACFKKGNYKHNSDHGFMKVLNYQQSLPSLSGLSHCPANMKKISEQGQYEEMSNYLQQIEQKCQNCNQSLEQLYISCETCLKNGAKYIICSSCSDNKSYIHDIGHEMQLKKISQGSKLTRMISRPSQTQSIDISDMRRSLSPDYRNSQIKIVNTGLEESVEFHTLSKTESRNNLLESFCQQLDYKEAITKNTMDQDDDPIFGEKFVPIPIQNFQPKQSEKPVNYVNPEQSVVRIDMGASTDLDTRTMRQSINTTPLFAPYSFPSRSQIRLKSTKHSNPEQQYVFSNYACDICNGCPIKNKRYHCNICEDYDLCQICYLRRVKEHQHDSFEEIDGRLLWKKQKDLLETRLRETNTRDFSRKAGQVRESLYRTSSIK